MSEELVKQEINKPMRDEKGRLLPGNTANPNGRPQGVSIVSRLKEIFEEEPERFQQYCEDIIRDPKMKRDVMEQLDGRPKQRVELTGAGGKDLFRPSEEDRQLVNKALEEIE